MVVARILLVVLFGCAWFVAVVFNAWILWRQIRRIHAPSVIPVFGGLLGGGAVLLVPLGDLSDRWPWAFVPMVLDFGCAQFFLSAVIEELGIRGHDRKRSG